MSEAVWAKLRYCPYWPAKIVEPPPGLKKRTRKFCVYFFGSNNYGFVDIENAISYVQHRTKYSKKVRGKAFALAVSQCDEYVKNPKDFDNNSVPKQITVAEELGFFVKEEPQDDSNWYLSEEVNVSKERDNCSDCSKKDELINSLTAEKQELLKNLDAKTEKVVKLETTVKRMESLHQMEKEDFERKLEHMTQNMRDTNHLSQQTEKRDFVKKTEARRSNVKKNYAVERLLAHKIEEGKQKFLVKWKGFDNRSNSWIERKNLNCQQLLRDYFKKEKLNQ